MVNKMAIDATPRHCVYCDIVLGESMFFTDDIGHTVEEWEPYVAMTEGPVCWNCVACYELVRASWQFDQSSARQRRVARRLRRHNRVLQPVNALTPQEEANKIRVLYAQGLSQVAVGEKLGMGHSTVHRRMVQFGIKSRPACPRGPRNHPNRV